MAIRLEREGANLFARYENDSGERISVDVSVYQGLGADGDRLLHSFCSYIDRLRRRSAVNYLRAAVVLGRALVRTGIQQLPNSESHWQELALLVYREILTNPDFKASLQTRATDSYRTARTLLEHLQRDGIIPLSTIFPQSPEKRVVAALLNPTARLLGETGPALVETFNSKLLCDILLSRTDAEYLDEIRDQLLFRRHQLRETLLTYWQAMKSHIEWGAKALKKIDAEALISELKAHGSTLINEFTIRGKKHHYHYCNPISPEGLARLLTLFNHTLGWLPSHDEVRASPFLPRILQYSNRWCYPHSLLPYWYESATGSKLPPEAMTDLLSVPDHIKKPIIEWLTANDYYREPNVTRVGYLDRRRIAKAMGWNVQLIKMNSNFSVFLRQFEPSVTSNLLIGREFRREFPSHKTLTLEEAREVNNASSALLHWQTISTLLSLRIHIPQFIPDTTNIHQGEIGRFAYYHSKPNKHTPWVPLKLALHYTNEALRWVILYGDDIVDLYLHTIEELRAKNLLGGPEGRMAKLPMKRRAAANAIDRPRSLKKLNIDGWQSKLLDCHDYSEFRSAPGLNDILAIFVGAVTVLFSFLKPIRQTEEQDLRRDTVRFKEGDGYWERQSLAKARLADQRPPIERPIPRVVARGLLQIDRLCEGLRKLQGLPTGRKSDLLFFLPDRDAGDNFSLHPMTAMRMNGYIDRFCDYLDTPTDEHGRRWYGECVRTMIGVSPKCFRVALVSAALS